MGGRAGRPRRAIEHRVGPRGQECRRGARRGHPSVVETRNGRSSVVKALGGRGWAQDARDGRAVRGENPATAGQAERGPRGPGVCGEIRRWRGGRGRGIPAMAVDVLNDGSSLGPLFEPLGSLPKISKAPEFASRHSRRYSFLVVGRNNHHCRMAQSVAPMMKPMIGVFGQ